MFYKTNKQQGFVSYRVGIMDFYKAVNKAGDLVMYIFFFLIRT